MTLKAQLEVLNFIFLGLCRKCNNFFLFLLYIIASVNSLGKKIIYFWVIINGHYINLIYYYGCNLFCIKIFNTLIIFKKNVLLVWKILKIKVEYEFETKWAIIYISNCRSGEQQKQIFKEESKFNNNSNAISNLINDNFKSF